MITVYQYLPNVHLRTPNRTIKVYWNKQIVPSISGYICHIFSYFLHIWATYYCFKNKNSLLYMFYINRFIIQYLNAWKEKQFILITAIAHMHLHSSMICKKFWKISYNLFLPAICETIWCLFKIVLLNFPNLVSLYSQISRVIWLCLDIHLVWIKFGYLEEKIH